MPVTAGDVRSCTSRTRSRRPPVEVETTSATARRSRALGGDALRTAERSASSATKIRSVPTPTPNSQRPTRSVGGHPDGDCAWVDRGLSWPWAGGVIELAAPSRSGADSAGVPGVTRVRSRGRTASELSPLGVNRPSVGASTQLAGTRSDPGRSQLGATPSARGRSRRASVAVVAMVARRDADRPAQAPQKDPCDEHQSGGFDEQYDA